MMLAASASRMRRSLWRGGGARGGGGGGAGGAGGGGGERPAGRCSSRRHPLGPRWGPPALAGLRSGGWLLWLGLQPLQVALEETAQFREVQFALADHLCDLG